MAIFQLPSDALDNLRDCSFDLVLQVCQLFIPILLLPLHLNLVFLGYSLQQRNKFKRLFFLRFDFSDTQRCVTSIDKIG